MEDLIAFLNARLREDEQVARATLWEGSGNRSSWDLPASATVEVGTDEFYAGDSTIARHIARHDPARVLAEVNAKRRVVDRMEAVLAAAKGDSEVDHYGGLDAAENTLELLALPYADHPDYRDEWRP